MRPLLSIAALVLLVSACGSADGTSTAASGSPRWLSSVLENPPTEDGWILPAGTWATQAFSTPFVFDTDRELALVAEDDQIVYLSTPGANDLIMVARFTGMWNGSADVPVPAETDAMTAAWKANPANAVSDNGVLTGDGADTPWWDITITERPEFTLPCMLGTTCTFNAFAGDSKIFSLQGERMRSYARNDLDVGLGVHAAGAAASMEETVSASDAIAPSLRAAPDDLDPPPTDTFIGLHKGSQLPSGPHTVPMDTMALLLDMPETVEGVDWFSSIGSIEFGAGESTLIISHPVLVDLDAPLGCPGTEFGPPSVPTDYLPLGPVSEGELEEYLESQSEVVDSGTAELLGGEASWWELGEPRSERMRECGATLTQHLISYYEGGIPVVENDPPMNLRIYHVNDRLMVISYGPVDDPISEFGPVLEHISIL